MTVSGVCVLRLVDIYMFEVPYPRPTTFTDGSRRVTNDEARRSILNTPDTELTHEQLYEILGRTRKVSPGPARPAGIGTYRESVYFLPIAFKRFLARPTHGWGLVQSLVLFVDCYSDKLKQDSLLVPARRQLKESLEFLTEDFRVEHMTAEEFEARWPQARGSGLPYFDSVVCSDVVNQFLDELGNSNTLRDIAHGFVAETSETLDAADRSAWFLEIARAHVANSLFQMHIPGPTESILKNRQTTKKHADFVRRCLATFADHPTYWSDTLRTLGLE